MAVRLSMEKMYLYSCATAYVILKAVKVLLYEKHRIELQVWQIKRLRNINFDKINIKK